MTVQIIRGTGVNRPTPDRLNSSVLDHATVVGKADFGLRNNEGLWPSYNCLDTLVPAPMCPDPLLGDPDEGGFKEFSVADWVPGFEFAVYGATQCSAVGLDKADQFSETKRVFEANEAKGVERALRLNRFAATTSGDPVSWDAPVDLGEFHKVSTALAALVGYAATVYAGQPTLHLPRSVALVAFGLGMLVERDGKFYTKTGAKVAAGGGYDVNFGLMTLYATGEVYVEKSDEIQIQSIVLPGDGSGIGSGENGLADNTVVSLAERMFRVGVDCFVAQATVDLTEGSL